MKINHYRVRQFMMLFATMFIVFFLFISSVSAAEIDGRKAVPVKFENGTRLVPEELPEYVMPPLEKMPEPIQNDYIIIPVPEQHKAPVKSPLTIDKKYVENIGDIELRSEDGNTEVNLKDYSVSVYNGELGVSTVKTDKAPEGIEPVVIHNHRDGTTDRIYVQDTGAIVNVLFVSTRSML